MAQTSESNATSSPATVSFPSGTPYEDVYSPADPIAQQVICILTYWLVEVNRGYYPESQVRPEGDAIEKLKALGTTRRNVSLTFQVGTSGPKVRLALVVRYQQLDAFVSFPSVSGKNYYDARKVLDLYTVVTNLAETLDGLDMPPAPAKGTRRGPLQIE